MSTTLRPPSSRVPLVQRVASSRLARALTTPHGLAAYLAPFEPTLAASGDVTRVVDVTAETRDTATLTIRTPRVWTTPLAGQHVLLGVDFDGRRQTRAFSLSSSARRDDDHVTVTVKVNPDGVVSRHLVHGLQPGTVVTLSTPRGEFLLPDGDDPMLLASGGSGITPVMAMLRTLADDVTAGGAPRPVTLLHYTHAPDDVPFADELACLDAAHDWLRLVVVVTGDDTAPAHGLRGGDTAPAHGLRGDDTASAHGLRGRIAADHLDAVLTRRDVHVRACGPAGLVTTLQDLLDGDDRVASLDVELFHPPTSDAAASGGTVTFARSGVEVVDDGRPLLDQAEAAGLTPQSGCRMGICHTCIRPRLDGVVRDVVSGTTSDEDTDTVRLCVSVPCGDVSVDL